MKYKNKQKDANNNNDDNQNDSNNNDKFNKTKLAFKQMFTKSTSP